MLEQKRKDTHTGFSDLAESNKELKSLKSGDLHRGISRSSAREGIKYLKNPVASSSQTDEAPGSIKAPSIPGE
jgi:hypothetical protein